jgi:hypothetical protein
LPRSSLGFVTDLERHVDFRATESESRGIAKRHIRIWLNEIAADTQRSNPPLNASTVYMAAADELAKGRTMDKILRK